MAERPEDTISAAGFPVYLHGFSAIDSYLGRSAASAVHILCGGDLASLARLFDNLRYPGATFADAAVDYGGKTWYFRCEELRNKPVHRASFGFLEFYQDCTTNRFYDPNGIYPHLRRIRDGAHALWTEVAQPRADDSCRILFDAALILAKYFPHTSVRELRAIAATLQGHNNGPPSGAEEQRLLLTGLLEAPTPAAGFELLKNCGFIATHWQELAALDEVDHSKEYHPEGNVWKHT
ncbi:MAG: phosphohydrolase, partial [Treponema sp.]|nr:phosphohydrolase [Treponema sp.]